MDDLAAFLAARMDEREAAANETHMPRHCGCVDRDGEFDAAPVYCCCDGPARVLREVAAGRAILAAWQDSERERGDSVSYTDGLADGLRLAALYLAAIHGDHPEYQEAWRP